MESLYNKLEHLENLIIAMNQQEMKRIKLPIPEEYGGGWATGETIEAAVRRLIDRVENYKETVTPFFKDYLEEWLKMKSEEDISVVTVANYRHVSDRYLIPYFGEMRIGNIGPDDIQAYFNHIMIRSKSYSNQSRTVLCGVFDKAARNKIIKDNPMWYKYRSSQKAGEKVVLQDDDLLGIIRDLDKLTIEREYIYVCFLCFTALRREEILGLRWGDIDFEKKTINVQNAVKFPNGYKEPVVGPPKCNSFGVTRLANMLGDRIFRFKGEKDHYIICYDSEHRTQPITRKKFENMWYHIKNTVDMKGATSHSFRASYASMVAAHCNADAKTLQGLLRHKTPNLAMSVYAKKNENKMRTTEEAYDDYISKALENAKKTSSEQNGAV